MMLTLVAAAALGFAPIELVPTDDIWVYPHAAEPAKDANIRVWGANGAAVPADVSGVEEYSFGYLRWNLAGLPAGKKLKSAKLVLTQVADPGFSEAQAKEGPLEARLVSPAYAEIGWTYDQVEKILPPGGKDGRVGAASPSAWEAGKPVVIAIDLLKGPKDFQAAFATAQATTDKYFALAITTPLDMMALGRSAIYKVYTKEAETAANRPKLVLEFED
jgi:hypothetical protein